MSIICEMLEAPIITDLKQYMDCLGLWDRLMAIDLEKGCFSNSILGSNSTLGSNLTLGSNPILGSNLTLGSTSILFLSIWGWGRTVLETIGFCFFYVLANA